MNPSRVHEILETVRDDHDLVAEQVHTLENLEGEICGADAQHLERCLDILRGTSRVLQSELLPKLDDEEQGMFRLLRDRLPKGSTLIYELEAEHEQLRELCGRLREEVGWARHAKHRQPPVIADLQSLCAQIALLLGHHAQREEQILNHYSEPSYDPADGMFP